MWGDRFVSESALTSRIKAVRQALGDDGSAQRLVQTIRGRGYRFIATVTPLEGKTSDESADSVAAEPAISSRQTNLPAAPSRMIGRVRALAQIQHA